MGSGWNVVRAGMRAALSDLFTTAVVQLLWYASLLTVVAGPPATVALFTVGRRLAHGEVTDVGDFLAALRRYAGAGWRWALVNGTVLSFLWADVVLTGRFVPAPYDRPFQSFYVSLFAIWCLLQIFVLAFLVEQETPSVRHALRNAVLLVGRHPGFAAAVWLLTVALLAAGTLLFLAIAVVGGVLVGAIGAHAVRDRLALAPTDEGFATHRPLP